jgi:hypothetical protein
MPRPADYTPCQIRPGEGKTCYEPSHVVLFALGGEFAGQVYRYGEHILACLTHAGHILDAHRAHADTHGTPGKPIAPWLVGWTTRLPLPKLPDHAVPSVQERPRPWNPPTRVRRRAEA